MSQHFRITPKFILLLGTHELEPRVQEVTHRCPSMVPHVLKMLLGGEALGQEEERGSLPASTASLGP